MKKAFTLAEVLITLVIIGVVAVLVIPGVIENYNNKSWSTASDLFQKKLSEATKQMNTQGQLLNYSSTEDFINNGLSKYMKIIKKCSKDELDKCFASSLDYGTEVLDVDSLTAADNFGKDDWTTEPYGVVFDNGVTALILYNKDCSYIDPFNNQVDGTACLAVAYDVNGMKSPNAINKDLRTLNASLSKYACIAKGLKNATGVCVTQVLGNSMSTPNFELLYESDCMKIKDKYGLEYCYTYNGGIAGYDGGDPYASLVVACGGINKVASPEQLASIARYIYGNDSIGTNASAYNLNLIQERWDELIGARVPSIGSAYYFITNDEKSRSEVDRNFGPESSQYTTMQRGFAQRAFCVK